jgi:hypothetical protein
LNILNSDQLINLRLEVITTLTSDLVQIIPILDSSARLASSKTFITLASVVALPMQHTAKISSQ